MLVRMLRADLANPAQAIRAPSDPHGTVEDAQRRRNGHAATICAREHGNEDAGQGAVGIVLPKW